MDIFDPLDRHAEVKVGDYLRIETKGEPGVKIEGVVNWSRKEGTAAPFTEQFDIGDDSHFEVNFNSRDVIEKIERRRPVVELPETEGSAILVYDNNFLEDRVLVLAREDVEKFGNEPRGWIDRVNGVIWDDVRIQASFVQVLFDAGKPRSA